MANKLKAKYRKLKKKYSNLKADLVENLSLDEELVLQTAKAEYDKAKSEYDALQHDISSKEEINWAAVKVNAAYNSMLKVSEMVAQKQLAKDVKND